MAAQAETSEHGKCLTIPLFGFLKTLLRKVLYFPNECDIGSKITEFAILTPLKLRPEIVSGACHNLKARRKRCI